MPRYALVVLDGLGDLPSPETGGLSPIEAARTPNLDRLAARGEVGEVSVLGPGIAPESDAGALALLGIDPATESPGRGVLEALGSGLDLDGGAIAMRLNFATLGESGRVLDARVGRSLTSAEAAELAEALTHARLLEDEQVEAEVRSTVGHRGVLRLRSLGGGPLSPEVSNSDPFYERLGGLGRARAPSVPVLQAIAPLSGVPAADRTARLLNLWNERARSLLAVHPINAARARRDLPVANGLLLRQAGALPDPPSPDFQARTGLRGAAVTEMPVERGIARWLRLEDRFVGPMGADRDAALAERAELTLRALDASDFVYVHLKGPDEPGHDGRAVAKKEVIEAIDRAYFGPLDESADWAELRVAVTADHATPCVRKAHSDDPVPLVLAGAGLGGPSSAPRDWKFGSALPTTGSLGRIDGRSVLRRLLSAADVAAP